MVNKVFINLPVKDLKRSVDFFLKLGFKVDEKFTNEEGASIVVNDSIFVMLLVEKFYNSFTKKVANDTKTTSEVIVALSVESQEEVDEMIKKAIDAGGTATISQDYGWMRDLGFTDLDGHHWEIFYVDEKNIPDKM